MGFFDFIGDALSSVTDVVTKPISAVANAVSGSAAKVMAPVTNLAGKQWTMSAEWPKLASAPRAVR